MYQRIGVPVDLAHTERLDKAVATAAALARSFDAAIDMVSVTSPAPGVVAPGPEAFRKQLADYARACSERHGQTFNPHACISDDPAAELDRTLEAAFEELGADLLVVASHVPGLRDYLLSSNAGWLARHSKLSVLVVR
jgi:nucleotide-binding universal stress UspA family protein